MGPKPAPPTLPAGFATAEEWTSWDPLLLHTARQSAHVRGSGDATGPPGPSEAPAAAPPCPPALPGE
eukprot:501168-Lingulodinium_polyedra.AAC.1